MSRRRLSAVLGLVAVIAVAVPASTSAFDLNGNPPWPGEPGLIAYSAAVKGGDKWAVKQAVEAWNAAGPEVQFKSVPASQASFRIVYKDSFSCNQGFTAIGFPPFQAELAIGRCKGQDKYQQVQLIAHELGHTLGLDHDNTGCSTMNERTDFRGSPTSSHPYRCPAPPKGSWRCGLVTKDDAEGAKKLYGGTIEKLGPVSCKL